MPADRTLLPLAIGLLLCCHLCPRSEALPLGTINRTEVTSLPPPPQHRSEVNPRSGPMLQSIFSVPVQCHKGFKLTGNPPHCHKLV